MSKFRNGDRVVVAVGFIDKEGVVVDSFGAGDREIVSVRMWRGDDENEGAEYDDIGFRASDVRPAVTA